MPHHLTTDCEISRDFVPRRGKEEVWTRQLSFYHRKSVVRISKYSVYLGAAYYPSTFLFKLSKIIPVVKHYLSKTEMSKIDDKEFCRKILRYFNKT